MCLCARCACVLGVVGVIPVLLCHVIRVLFSVGGGGGGGEASTPNSLASTQKNSNCNTNYYGVGPT